MFGFKSDQTPHKHDPRVKETIVDFLTKYFEQNPENTLIFVCDTSDKRQDARFKMFNNWFQENDEKSDHSSNILKTNISFCDENDDNCAHASLLISIRNPRYFDISNAFRELDSNFKDKFGNH